METVTSVRAATLDREFYRDEAAYAAAREQIFARTWQWLGPLADVRSVSSLAPRDLLPGLLDEPLLLTRDAEGVLRCLSNVCTHRANILVTTPCSADKKASTASRKAALRAAVSPSSPVAVGPPSPAPGVVLSRAEAVERRSETIV